MGRGLGALLKGLGLGLLVILFAPIVALGPATVVDRGWDGGARVSAFPPALVVLDPLVWRCVRNSSAVALLVTVGALAIGTGLGLLLGRRRFWGRWPLGGLAMVPLAIGPTWLAPGVIAWLGGDSGWDWLAARSFLGQPGDEWARWAALVWVELATGVPLAILATRRGLARVDPAWADAARVVGAGRLRVWLDVSWPTLRPELARAAGRTFTLTLIEPAGPLLLGLRRTLAVGLADAALRNEEPNRAATLALIAVAICLVARAACRRWGGSDHAPPSRPPSRPAPPRAGFRLGWLAVLALLAWAGCTLGPVAGFARRLGDATLAGRPLDGATARSVARAWAGPEMQAWAGNAALAATLAVVIDLLLLAVRPAGLRASAGRWARPFAAIPPLALGAGALAIPSLLAAWAHATGQPALAATLETLRAELSPGRSPGVLLILVLAATHLPLVGSGGRAGGSGSPAAPVDAALLAGASARQAGRLARGVPGRGLGMTVIAAWTWASTDLAGAWLLTSLAERRTLAPAALALMSPGGDPPDPRLLGLFVATVAVRLVGVACLVRAHRSGHLSSP